MVTVRPLGAGLGIGAVERLVDLKINTPPVRFGPRGEILSFLCAESNFVVMGC
jgi:hypothetical protein